MYIYIYYLFISRTIYIYIILIERRTDLVATIKRHPPWLAMVSKIFSQFLLILAARIPSSPYRNLGRWPFLMLISEHLPNLPNLPLFVCWSKCWSNPRVGQCSEWHRRRLCRFSSASARSCSTRASFLSNILSWPQFAGREDVVFCDLLSKKTYDNHLIANVQNIFYSNTHRQTTK